MIKKIDRYEIRDKIGSGAMGIVYHAYDPSINRTVAIKTLKMDIFNDDEAMEFKARFRREAQTAGNLSHPSIVTIHDLGEDEASGKLYIVMEFVLGKNISEILKTDKTIEIHKAVNILYQIADGLDYAHQNKIIHRDIKPANIIITEDSRVKITDFGIAKISGASFTQAGKTIGTPSYMSPEQIKGRDISPRSDIFSLGVLTFEMLTGQKAFLGEDITATMYKILNEYPVFPKNSPFSSNNPLKSVLNKCLDKDPENRYKTASEFVSQIKTALFDLSSDTMTQGINIITEHEKENHEKLLIKLRSRYVDGELDELTYYKMKRDIELDYQKDRYRRKEISKDEYNELRNDIEQDYKKDIELSSSSKNISDKSSYNYNQDFEETKPLKDNDATIEQKKESFKVSIKDDGISVEKNDKNILETNNKKKIIIFPVFVIIFLIVLFLYFLYPKLYDKHAEEGYEKYDDMQITEDIIDDSGILISEIQSAISAEDIITANDKLKELKTNFPDNDRIIELESLLEKKLNALEKDKIKKHEPGDRYEMTIGEVKFGIRYIPAGIFTMGSPEYETDRDFLKNYYQSEEGRIRYEALFGNEFYDFEERQRDVSISSSYWMMETEVTQALFEAVTGENPSFFNDNVQNPVENITWYEAVEFCRKLSELTGLTWELPTEAEWEYACRAGTTTAFHYGDKIDSTMANFNGNFPYGDTEKGAFREKTVPVRSFNPNPWGLFDMHGNVWEWCYDWYGNYPSGSVKDPKGPSSSSRKVQRGGGYNSQGRNLRSAFRDISIPDSKNNNLGFRAVLRSPYPFQKDDDTEQIPKIETGDKEYEIQ